MPEVDEIIEMINESSLTEKDACKITLAATKSIHKEVVPIPKDLSEIGKEHGDIHGDPIVIFE